MYLVFSVCFLLVWRKGKKQEVTDILDFSSKLPYQHSASYAINLFSVVFMFFFSDFDFKNSVLNMSTFVLNMSTKLLRSIKHNL